MATTETISDSDRPEIQHACGAPEQMQVMRESSSPTTGSGVFTGPVLGLSWGMLTVLAMLLGLALAVWYGTGNWLMTYGVCSVIFGYVLALWWEPSARGRSAR